MSRYARLARATRLSMTSCSSRGADREISEINGARLRFCADVPGALASATRA